MTPPPTFAIVNARIWTADPRRPWADGLLVRDGYIAALGSSAELRKRAGGETRVADARGGLLVPAFVRERTVADFAAARRTPRTGDEGALRTGGLASFVLLDRDISRHTGVPAGEARVVLAVSAGCVTHDPEGLIGE